jgi:hypothetical protein
VLVEVHDSGSVDFDHDGLVNDAWRERQSQLELAVERRGVLVAQCP